MAIETAELLGRPTCSSCNDMLRKRRGCMRPGYNFKSDNACWRFTSPALQQPGWDMLRECPVGYLLREAPFVYDLISYLSLSDNMSPLDLARMPRYYQEMLRVYHSEKARIQDMHELQRQARRHADIATRAVHG